MIMPHCDGDVLHAPGVCPYCDKHPDLQKYRSQAGINFTGEYVEGKTLCPSEQRRSLKDINRWPGNRPEGYQW